jgi:uncharacterized membrane protein YeaQ/YmgE (transglycosylase-associated protein family)
MGRVHRKQIGDQQGQGFWLKIALGTVGALAGGFLFDLFGATGVTGLNAIVVLLTCNVVARIMTASCRVT